MMSINTKSHIVTNIQCDWRMSKHEKWHTHQHLSKIDDNQKFIKLMISWFSVDFVKMSKYSRKSTKELLWSIVIVNNHQDDQIHWRWWMILMGWSMSSTNWQCIGKLDVFQWKQWNLSKSVISWQKWFLKKSFEIQRKCLSKSLINHLLSWKWWESLLKIIKRWFLFLIWQKGSQNSCYEDLFLSKLSLVWPNQWK